MKKIVKKIDSKFKIASVNKIDLFHLKYKNIQTTIDMWGDSTYTFRNKRFILKGKQEIFKTYDGEFGNNIKDFRVNSEILCYYIGKQIGVKCAKVRPAKYGDYEGTISEVSLKQGDELLTGKQLLKNMFKDENQNSLESYDKYFCLISSLKRYRVKREKLITDLFKVCVFDFLTQQQDRHSENIHFVKRVLGGKVLVALYPLIDNEYAFAGFTLERKIKENSPCNVDDEDLFLDNSRLAINENNSNKHGFINSATAEVKSLVDYAYGKPECWEFLKNAVEKFDVKSIIKNLKNQGIEFTAKEEQWRIEVAESQKQKLKDEMESLKNFDFDKELENAINNFSLGRRI